MAFAADALRDVVGALWTSVEVVPVTGSTNADLLRRGGAEGQVLVAEEQTAGRGRMGRSWVSQPGVSLTFSVLLRPVSVPAARRGWLSLLTGVAVAAAVRDVAQVSATVKWPNDVLVGERKLAGILAEQSGDAVVVGIGVNVATPAGALPASPGGLRATSLLVEGGSVSREALLAGILRSWRPGTWPSGQTPTWLASACCRNTARCPRPSAIRFVSNSPAARSSLASPRTSTPTAGCWSRRSPATRLRRSQRETSSTSGGYGTKAATSWWETRSSQRVSASRAASSTTACS
jgi:biotin-[acetyl-CoA-carboxylase] ligase BirA-like protein